MITFYLIVNFLLNLDPVRDMKIIFDVLCLKDLDHCTKRLEDVKKTLKRNNNKADAEENELLEKCISLL